MVLRSYNENLGKDLSLHGGMMDLCQEVGSYWLPRALRLCNVRLALKI
jgi:hypothetical protein